MVEILLPSAGNAYARVVGLVAVKRRFVGQVWPPEHALGVAHLAIVHPAVADGLLDGGR